MNVDQSEPLQTAALLELDQQACVEQDSRPWNHVNDHAFVFWSESEITVERADAEGGYVLRSNAPILNGIPVRDEAEARGAVVARTLAERTAARQFREADRSRVGHNRRDLSTERSLPGRDADRLICPGSSPRSEASGAPPRHGAGLRRSRARW